jgi:tetratricopeptide (TPR) repeat protein
LGRYQEAIAAYEQVANRLPGRALWYQIEPILAYYEAGQFDRVLQITQQVFDSQNRAFAELHQLRGLIFEERGQVELAQQEFALARQYNTASYWQANL